MITSLLVSVVLLALNAFFVAAEFALVASKRHRLQDAAEEGSRAAKAAVKGSRELSLMLAGAQLGITLCTLGLGSLAKPAVAQLLTPVLEFLRLPTQVATVVAIILAVAIVVFLHMVVGEMAPKSWAIADPERSAILLALPFRAFAWVSRPVLALLNAMANGCLRLVGVEPQAELAQVHGPKELALLLRSSHEHGLLDEPEHRILTGAIALDTADLTTVLVPRDEVVTVPVTATAAEAEAVSREAGRSRLVVIDDRAPHAADAWTVTGMVHVRDLVRADPQAPAIGVAVPLMTLPAQLSLLDAVSAMRVGHAQLVLVGEPGAPIGIVTMEDLLEQVLGQFEDETDLRTA